MNRRWLGAALFAMIPLSAIALSWFPGQIQDRIADALADVSRRWIVPIMFVLVFANIGYRLFKADRR